MEDFSTGWKMMFTEYLKERKGESSPLITVKQITARLVNTTRHVKQQSFWSEEVCLMKLTQWSEGSTWVEESTNQKHDNLKELKPPQHCNIFIYWKRYLNDLIFLTQNISDWNNFCSTDNANIYYCVSYPLGIYSHIPL